MWIFSRDGTNRDPVYASSAASYCTAIFNTPTRKLHNFLCPCFSTLRSFLSSARRIQPIPSYSVECIHFSVMLSSLPVSAPQIEYVIILKHDLACWVLLKRIIFREFHIFNILLSCVVQSLTRHNFFFLGGGGQTRYLELKIPQSI
jgi:hypothetical protein